MPEPLIEGGSSESLLDTPVPDTPVTPLAPLLQPLTPTTPPDITQSMLNLNGDATPSEQENRKESRAQKSQSAGDLDDLDSLLNTISRTPKTRRRGGPRRDEASTFDLFTKEGKEELEQEVQAEKHPVKLEPQPLVKVDLVDGLDLIQTDKLIDLSSTSSTDSSRSTPIYKTREYPKGYSKQAVIQSVELQKLQGKITMRELMNICKKERTMNPPWVEDEQDRTFKGYDDMVAMLEDLGVDTKKVSIIISVAAQVCHNPERSRLLPIEKKDGAKKVPFGNRFEKWFPF